jgi:hypothetical protein
MSMEVRGDCNRPYGSRGTQGKNVFWNTEGEPVPEWAFPVRGHVRPDKRIVARFQAWQQAPGKPNKVLWPGQSKFSRHKGTFFVRQVIMDVYV